MSKPPYYIDGVSETNAQTLSILRLICGQTAPKTAGKTVAMYQNNEGQWILTVDAGMATEKNFKANSLTRVIERAGRALTTVFDR